MTLAEPRFCLVDGSALLFPMQSRNGGEPERVPGMLALDVRRLRNPARNRIGDA